MRPERHRIRADWNAVGPGGPLLAGLTERLHPAHTAPARFDCRQRGGRRRTQSGQLLLRNAIVALADAVPRNLAAELGRLWWRSLGVCRRSGRAKQAPALWRAGPSEEKAELRRRRLFARGLRSRESTVRAGRPGGQEALPAWRAAEDHVALASTRGPSRYRVLREVLRRIGYRGRRSVSRPRQCAGTVWLVLGAVLPIARSTCLLPARAEAAGPVETITVTLSPSSIVADGVSTSAATATLAFGESPCPVRPLRFPRATAASSSAPP